jgi:uncharacterized protein (DUF952 family)
VSHVFHLVVGSEWDSAGELYEPASLAEAGFVHFSFADQVSEVANRLYRNVDGLVAVEFDPALLGGPLVIEDSYGAGVEFPHLYGPVPTATAVAVHDLPRNDDDGGYRFDF